MDLTCSLDHESGMDRRTAQARSWILWLLPDLALFASIVTFGFCLLLFDGTRQLFRDSDSGWHIRTGEAILAGAGLPRTESYSLLRSGQPWFAWEWASDAAMGAAHQAGGLPGVALLFALVIAACTWLWFQLQWTAGGNFLIACLFAIPMLSTVNMHWLARPHVFSWLFLLGLMFFLEKERQEFSIMDALLAFGFTALWANMHASFFFAPVLCALYAISYWLRPLIWRLDRESEWARAQWIAALAACSLAGSFINPYGWQLHGHVIHYLFNKELLDRVGEFQSFNFHAAGASQILLVVGLSAIGGVLAFSQKKLAHALTAALLLAMALRSARALPLLALLLLPLANASITRALASCEDLQPRLQTAIRDFLAYSRNLRILDRKFSGALLLAPLLLLAVACLRLPAVEAHAGFPQDEFPVVASFAVAKLPLEARLLAPDKFGGYLIYRFNGARKVFFDGRSDFYGSDYMKEYLNLIEVRPGWQAQVAKAGFTHALL
ncbi:MAG TPA: hypothetical protein VMZ52_16040, partial [Bryobacteraceae bacterium]|nr:hypothetical protein [Bryobacteraceae bacterium]